MRKSFSKFGYFILFAAAFTLGFKPALAESIVSLTQTGCQFLEPEQNYDHGFKTAQANDCVKINSETGAARLAQVKPIRLKPGRYTFRVTNANVPYQLGFYLRAANPVARAFKPKLVGGGIETGKTKDYTVLLTPGDYIFSCPLNPTPDYPLIISE